jgi:hypothetical protein
VDILGRLQTDGYRSPTEPSLELSLLILVMWATLVEDHRKESVDKMENGPKTLPHAKVSTVVPLLRDHL